MKRKELKALHDKSVGELQKQLQEIQDTIFGLRLDMSQYKVKNTKTIFGKRREIAQLKTILKEKEQTK